MNQYLADLLDIQRRLKYVSNLTRKNLPNTHEDVSALLFAVDVLLKKAWLTADSELNQ